MWKAYCWFADIVDVRFQRSKASVLGHLGDHAQDGQLYLKQFIPRLTYGQLEVSFCHVFFISRKYATG